MKTLAIILVTFTTLLGIEKVQDKITIKATFDGYQDEIYFFSDADEGAYEFQSIDSVASKKYDLSDEKFKGKVFEVTYSTEFDIDDNDEEYTLYTILDLKLIQ